jgi:hypothetical protein
MRRRADALILRFLDAAAPEAAAAGVGREAAFPPIWLRRSAIFCSSWSRFCWKPIKAAWSSSVSCLGDRGISLIIPILIRRCLRLFGRFVQMTHFDWRESDKIPRWNAEGSSAWSSTLIIHLFDTARPQGVPWPDKNDAVLYKRVLDVAAKDSIVVGVIGDLEPVHGEAGIHPRTHSVGPGRLGARYCLPRRSWRTWRG